MNRSRRDVLKLLGLSTIGVATAGTTACKSSKVTEPILFDDIETALAETENEKALRKIKEAVQSPGGHFNWESIDRCGEWLIRIPVVTPKNELWMQEERIELIHLCDPLRFVEAMEGQKKDKLALYSDYVNDGVCVRCKTKKPRVVS